jgi:hypothetical protein
MTQYMLVDGIGVPLAMVITGVGSGGVTVALCIENR